MTTDTCLSPSPSANAANFAIAGTSGTPPASASRHRRPCAGARRLQQSCAKVLGGESDIAIANVYGTAFPTIRTAAKDKPRAT
jgi:hypothetical protein